MAAPVIQSQSALVKQTISTTITITKPSGVVEGDFLLACLIKDDDDAITGVPTGWTAIEDTPASTSARVASYKKIATGSEPADYTWTGDSEQWLGIIFRIDGHDPAAPVNISDENSGNSTSPTSPDVITTVDECLIFAFFGSNTDTTPVSVDGSLTEVFADVSVPADGGAVSGAGGWENLASAGASGTNIHSQNSAQAWAAHTIAIAPAIVSLVELTHIIHLS